MEGKGKGKMDLFQHAEMHAAEGAATQQPSERKTTQKRAGYTVNLRNAEIDFVVEVQSELRSLGFSVELSEAARGALRAAHDLGIAKMLAAAIAGKKLPTVASLKGSDEGPLSTSSIDVEALLAERARNAPFLASARDLVESTPALSGANLHRIDAMLRSIAKHSTRLVVRQAGKRNSNGKGTLVLWSFVLAQKQRAKS